MATEKKKYEKPVVQDLGQILSGAAQMPMGLCSSGDSPSEAQSQCQGGNSVSTECGGGNLFTMPENICQAGGAPVDYCGWGSGI